MLTILLADTELETIPDRMLEDPAIRRKANESGKKASDMILDSNYMHTAIERHFPGYSNRMGRPDMVHFFLITALESVLNKSGELRVVIHTRNNLAIFVNPKVRIPRGYNRFIGLMEDMFRKRLIRSGDDVLLEVKEMDLSQLLSRYDHTRKIMMWPKGTRSSLSSIISDSSDLVCVIGGFSEGDFRSDVSQVNEKYSIFPEELVVWSVSAEVVAQYERSLRLL